MPFSPAAPRAFAAIATPTSFSRETYNGIDAFVLVNAAGTRQRVRFRAVPYEGTQHLSAAEAVAKPPNFLIDELPRRLAKGPAKFHLMAQLAGPGDSTKDPTQPWPPTDTLVDLGTITLTTADADSATADKSLLFLPGNLTDGIEPSDDPLIDARNQAYEVSFGRRSQ